MTKSLIAAVLVAVFSSLFGQDKICGNETKADLQVSSPFHALPGFEEWLNEKIVKNRLRSRGNRISAEILTVPVVFHIIHNSEAIGDGANVSDIKIQNQLVTLNRDFRRQNLDADETKPEFLNVAVDTEIEFVMASIDPDGRPTTGIIRTKGPQETYGISSSDFELAAEISGWPPEHYLNIWVLPIVNQGRTALGVAKFPISSDPAISGSDANWIVDGVMVRSEFIGTDPVGFSRGRTLTHEIGHYFGLRHTFENGCNGNGDYCDDTPAISGFTSGCPLNKSSCNGVSDAMIENYMDYTQDQCMSLFTQDQKERMLQVLQNSPRRKSLTNRN